MRPRAAHAPPRERDHSTPPHALPFTRARAACTSLGHDAVKRCPRTPAVRTQDCASGGVTAGTLLAPARGHDRRGAAPIPLRRHSHIYARAVLRETQARGNRPPHRRPRRARDFPRAGKKARASRAPLRRARVPCLPFLRHARTWLRTRSLRCLRLRPTRGFFLQRPGFLPLLRRAPHGRHRGASRGPRAPRGPRSTVGTPTPLRAALPPGLRRAEHEHCPLALRAHRLRRASPPCPPAVEHRPGPVRRGHLVEQQPAGLGGAGDEDCRRECSRR